MIIGGLHKNSLIDYPGKISCVIFLSGCNFDCPYCHNPELAKGRSLGSDFLSEDLIFDFLEIHKGFLDGVVISGGEPTLQKGLISFCKKIRLMGYPVKLDTNGSRPEVISKLIDEGLVNYIAMDIEGDTTDSALVVDAELFADKPFSSLLRNVHNSIGVPERNLYTVKKILSDPDVEKLLPYDSQFLWSAKPERITSSGGKTENYFLLYHLNREAGIQGKYIKKATASIGGAQTKSAGQPIININMNSEGARIFSRLTGSNIGKFLAIVLDDKVYMAPSINVKIPNGSAYIEGLENMEEAKNIAIILRAGALPAPVDVIEERTIGPSLGRDSINIGTKVGLIGFLLVIGFMVLYYKQSGLLARIAITKTIFNTKA
ncbi:MAG: anaerobic ribonucleoside-triphosphate reductase activating protein, partial [Proteobacteria bacterium]|nr:anaerobic ribonucleoside-triphosphate reductase activating protein [Pseudomonadota bacterium]